MILVLGSDRHKAQVQDKSAPTAVPRTVVKIHQDDGFCIYYAGTAKQCQTCCLLLNIASIMPTMSNAIRRPTPTIRIKDNPDDSGFPGVAMDAGVEGVAETVLAVFPVGSTTDLLGGG